MVQEVAKYISNQIGSLVLGTNLFTEFRPDSSPDNCDLVIDAGGFPSFMTPAQFECRIRIISRSTSNLTARSRAQAIYNVLHGKSAVTLPTVTSGLSYLVDTMRAVDRPQQFNKDEGGRVEYITTYLLRTQTV